MKTASDLRTEHQRGLFYFFISMAFHGSKHLDAAALLTLSVDMSTSHRKEAGIEAYKNFEAGKGGFNTAVHIEPQWQIRRLLFG